MTDEDVLLFSRAACTPHFTWRTLKNGDPEYSGKIVPVYDDRKMLTALFDACSGKKAVAAVPECEPDFEITLSVDGEEYYVFSYKMSDYPNDEKGIVTIYTAGYESVVSVVGSVILSQSEDYAICEALGLVDG